ESFYSGILRRADRRVGPELEGQASPPPPALPGFDLYGRTGGPPHRADPRVETDRDFRHPLFKDRGGL
ncbi:MAG: hypothetical protein ACK2UB_04390, partial [Anaerolineales bacterium]